MNFSSKDKKSFFDLFGLLEKYSLDQDNLKSCYVKLQQQYHPDRLTGHSSSLRMLAAQQSAYINEGFSVLNDPLSRAEYMLQLSGIDVENSKPNMALLEKAMQQREQLMEACDLEDLEELSQAQEEEIASLYIAISNAFDQKEISEAMNCTLALRYCTKINDEIQQKIRVIGRK